MTERQWLACGDPERMLEFLKGKASHRKLRLFACACCRRIWHLLTDKRSRSAVELAERHADLLADGKERRHAAVAAQAATMSASGLAGQARHAATLSTAVHMWGNGAGDSPAWLSSDQASSAVAFQAIDPRPDSVWGSSIWVSAKRGEQAVQSNLLRDIFGNPFRPVTLGPSWRTPDVVTLAQAAYDNRTLPAGTLEPERLALLADALEDAGCANRDILGHLRSPEVHVRGCWALDLILGKE
jgi:hypothetical protein